MFQQPTCEVCGKLATVSLATKTDFPTRYLCGEHKDAWFNWLAMLGRFGHQKWQRHFDAFVKAQLGAK